ncbi:MAG: glycosyltransferase family 87 protein [Sphingomicrobium sp.]
MATQAEVPGRIRAIVRFGATLLLVGISVALVILRIRNWPITPDFTMLWAGARFAVTRPHDTYNWAAVTAAQMSLRPPVGPLPFPYPPSALPLMAPFGLLPFWPAFWLWTLLSAVAFWTAARRITSNLLLAFIVPQMVLALLLGQTALWIGTLLIFGVLVLPRRPFLAGALFGIAAAIKPQFAILVPIAVIAGRHWRAIPGGALGLGGMILASLPFGPFLWRDWASVLGEHPAIVTGYGLDVLGASPMMLLKVLGLSLYLHLIFIVFAIFLVWRAFRTDDQKLKVLVLLAATLLASPYSIRYELAMLSPSLVDALLTGTARGLLVALPLYCLNVFTIVPALVISTACALLGPVTRKS